MSEFAERSTKTTAAEVDRSARGLTGPKRILLIAPQPFFVSRGTPINVRAILEALVNFGYEVDLLVYALGAPITLDGVNIFRCPAVPGIREVPIGPSWRKVASDIPLFFSALRLVIRQRYSLIHGVEEGSYIAGLLARLRGVPYVFDMDSCMPDQLRSSGFVRSRLMLWCVSLIDAYFVRHAAAVLTVCRALSDYVRQVKPESRVYQIEDFPLAGASHVDAARYDELNALYRKGERKIILYTGNLERYQGIDLLLEALREVARKTADADSAVSCGSQMPLLLIVGGGALNAEGIQHYARKAEMLGISRDVVFVGSRPAEEMGTYMAFADVLVSPRLEGENTPLKLYSYLAAGKPIVATRILSHTQVLSEENAILAGTEPAAFAEALRLAVDDSPEAVARNRALGKAAKLLVEERYNERNFRASLSRLYMDVLGPASPRDSVEGTSEGNGDRKAVPGVTAKLGAGALR